MTLVQGMPPSLTAGPEQPLGNAAGVFMSPDWDHIRKPLATRPAKEALKRLVLPRLRRRLRRLNPGSIGRTGSGVLPYQGGPGELALEASLERLAPGRMPKREDLLVYGRDESVLNLLVLLDTSLSLSGQAHIPAAVAGAVLARESAMARLALVAFHQEVETVFRFGQRVHPLEAAYRVLRLKWGGATDLHQALCAGRKIMKTRPPGITHTVLITDAERTAGPDPRTAAEQYKGLHVLLIGRRNLGLARELARLGGGGLKQAQGLGDLPQALMDLLAGLARPV